MVNFIPYINIHSYIHFSIQVHKKHTYIHTYIHTDRQTKIMYIFRLPGIVYIHTYIHNITYIPSSLRMVGINTFLTVSLSLQSLYHACVDQLASEADVEAIHSFIHSFIKYIHKYIHTNRMLGTWIGVSGREQFFGDVIDIL